MACVLAPDILPLVQVFGELLDGLFVTRIDGLLILAHLAYLRAGQKVGDDKVVLIDDGMNGPAHFAIQHELWKVKVLGHRTGKSNAVNRGKSVVHGAHGAETTSDVGLGLLQWLDDCLGKVEEETLTLASRFALVSEAQALIRASGKFHKVEARVLESLAERASLLGRETSGLKFDRVDLDAEDKGWRNTRAHRSRNLENQPHALLQRATVLIGAKIGRGRQELCKKVTVSTVQLDPIEAGLFEILGSMSEAFNDIANILVICGAWLSIFTARG